MVEQCSKVFIDCEEFFRVPYGQVVYRGYSNGKCTVVMSIPSTCVLSPTTVVLYTEYLMVKEHYLTNNVRLEVLHPSGKKKPKRYIYPRSIYEEFKKLYIEPVSRGEDPYSIGVILAGAPGTGKSTLATLTAKLLGLPVYVISADRILSKYVGESEQNLKNTIEDARANQPSIIIIDEAEWLMKSRSLAKGGEEMSEIKLQLQDILFSTMQEITDNGEKVLFIATTNVKESEIDVAFKRYGRFGYILTIPLPDYEAIHDMLLQYFSDPKAEDLARRFVNMGLSMSDVVGQIKRLLRGLDIKMTTQSGRGYRRIYVDRVAVFMKVYDYIPIEAMDKRSRIYIPYQEDVATAVAVQLSYMANKNVTQIIDLRHLDEAIHMANVTNSTLIVSSTLEPSVLDYIHNNASVPVFFVGEVPPRKIPFYPFYPLEYLAKIVTPRAVVEAVATLYNVHVPDNLWKKIEYKIAEIENLEKLLKIMISLGVINEKILDQL